MIGSYAGIFPGFAPGILCAASLVVSKAFSLQLKQVCGLAHNLQALLAIHIDKKKEHYAARQLVVQ